MGSFDSGRDGGGCTKLLRSSSWKILKDLKRQGRYENISCWRGAEPGTKTNITLKTFQRHLEPTFCDNIRFKDFIIVKEL